MPTITARLEEWLDREIRRFWDERGEGPSTGLRRVAREWWTLQNLPHLHFRDGPDGRRAGIRGGPDVWEVALLVRDYGRDVSAIHDHLGGRLPAEAIEDALTYLERFSEEIDEQVTRNDRLERLLQDRAAG